MTWVIVFFMAISGQPTAEFVVDGPGYVSRAKCELAIEAMQLPKKPKPMCVQQGFQ